MPLRAEIDTVENRHRVLAPSRANACSFDASTRTNFATLWFHSRRQLSHVSYCNHISWRAARVESEIQIERARIRLRSFCLNERECTSTCRCWNKLLVRVHSLHFGSQKQSPRDKQKEGERRATRLRAQFSRITSVRCRELILATVFRLVPITLDT